MDAKSDYDFMKAAGEKKARGDKRRMGMHMAWEQGDMPTERTIAETADQSWGSKRRHGNVRGKRR